MNKSFIDKYLSNLKIIRELYIQLDDILENKLDIIDLMTNFILNNQEYLRLESFKTLTDILVDVIEKYNSNLLDIEEIKNYINKFKVLVKDLEKEISSECKLSVYFYGKDKYGFIANNLTNIDIINIDSLKQLQILSSSNKKNKNEYNILFLGNENIKLKNKYFDEVLFYNKIADAIQEVGDILFKQKYDLNFLQFGIDRCLNENLDAVIIGNSYSLTGISEYNINRKATKLSMNSQDLYYSVQLAKKAIELNKNIKECIFGISYYILRHDLSRGRNEYSKSLMKNIYYPLLKDTHNSNENYESNLKSIEDYGVDILISSIFNLQKIEKFIAKNLYNIGKTYYNEITNPRETIKWSEMSDEDKKYVGLNRAFVHNKMFKYEETKIEHEILLKDFVEFLKNNDVKLTVIVFPTTKQYSDNIIVELKEELETVLRYLKDSEVNVLDLREYSHEFCDLDFEDSDHLSSHGEEKATRIINSLLDKRSI